MWFKHAQTINTNDIIDSDDMAGYPDISKIDSVHDNEWLSLQKIVDPDNHIDGYIFSHETRCDGKIIAILPYQKNQKGDVEYLIREEVTPCWDDKPIKSSLTGGLEKGKTPAEIALEELQQESGYSIEPDELIELGTVFGTKSCDTTYFLYTADLTNKTQGTKGGDGTYLDENGTVSWENEDIFDTLKDPIIFALLHKVKKHLKLL